MSHPFKNLRDNAVSKRRVGGMTKGYATGGAARGISSGHGDAAEDLKMLKATVKPGSLKMDAPGKASGGRLDKAPRKPTRASGGKVKKAGGGGAWGVTKFDNGYLTGERHGDTVYVSGSSMSNMNRSIGKDMDISRKIEPGLKFVLPGRASGGAVGTKKGTNVNIIIAPQGGAAAGGPPTPMLPPPAAGGIGSPSPVPPAIPSGIGAAAGMPPELPPGAGPMRNGGRAYAKGGSVWEEGRRNGTQVQHTDGKNDGKDIYRPKQVTYAKGGKVHMTGGAEGGIGRLEKARMQKGKR